METNEQICDLFKTIKGNIDTTKTLKNFLKDNHLNCVRLGKFMKTSPAVIRKWTRGNHIMTEYSFIKLKKALVENGYEFSGLL